MVTTSPPARSVQSPSAHTRTVRAALATTLAATLALGTVVVADTAVAAESVPFAPISTISVPAGVSDVSVDADGSELLAFSAAGSSLSSIALDDCEPTSVGLDPQDCTIDWSATLTDESRAWFVDTSGAGQVFVLAQRGSDGVITRFDRATGAVIGVPIVVPGHAVRALTYVPVSNTAYVLADDGVVLVDIATAAVTTTIAPRSDAPDPALAPGQQAIIYNAFSTGTGNATPQGIVYAAYGEYLTTVNVSTGTRVETTRRLTTAAAVSQSGVSDPVAATPSLFVAGTLSTGTYRTFGISSEVVHGRDQNAVYLYNTLSGGSTSTSAVAWVPTDPRGLALSTTTDEVFAASSEGNTISVVAAASTGTTAPKPVLESVSLDTASSTVAGSIDVGGLAVATTASGVAVYAANPASRTVTVLERAPLVDSSVPTITGDPRVGSTLSAVPGEWTTGTEFDYQWLADGAPIAGANATSYDVQPADLGSAITVEMTGGQPGYAPVSQASVPTATVVEGVLETVQPTTTGTARVGKTLTAKPGTWAAGTTLRYQWLADGKAITSATRGNFALTAAQRRHRITVVVTGTRPGYETASAASAATGKVAYGQLSTSKPRISGTARVGKTLRAAAKSWTTGAKVTYRWYASGTKITGATKSTLTLASKYAGKKVTVRVTSTKPGYTTVVTKSAATKRVAR